MNEIKIVGNIALEVILYRLELGSNKDIHKIDSDELS